MTRSGANPERSRGVDAHAGGPRRAAQDPLARDESKPESNEAASFWQSMLQVLGLARGLSTGQRTYRLARTGTTSAAAISLIIHLTLWLIAAIITVGAGQAGGAGDTGPSGIDVAVVTEGELAGEAEASGAMLSAEAPAVADLPMLDVPEIALDDLSGGAVSDIGSELVGELGGLGDSLGAGDPTGGGLGLGGGGGGGAASFFGREAVGNRFAYVIDVSGSMGDLLTDPRGETVGAFTKIDTLKRELTKSIQALLEQASFCVVLFSSGAQVLGDRRPEWIVATDPGKKAAKTDIAKIGPGGGTDPIPAIEVVFEMRPRPDAVYLMTDGNFDQGMAVADIVKQRNADLRIPIHCITIGRPEEVQVSKLVMQRIAKESGGTYAHVRGSLP